MRRVRLSLWIVAAALLVAPVTSAVTMDWVTVGDPGNAADDTGYGSVADSYRIGKYEVTVGQYAEFLSAVATSDPHNLYENEMSEWQGITRTGSDGNYSYLVEAGRGNRAIGHIRIGNALRFANWMNNGQGNADTESGAYTITGPAYSNGLISRNPGASIFLPTEDQWYKAAYFDASSSNYFEYPTSADVSGTCSAPSANPNTANCGSVLGGGKEMTDVGAYTESNSPYGTFDQAGNAWEWNESALVWDTGGVRGGSTGSNNVGPGFTSMAASYSDSAHVSFPDRLDVAFGFRLAATIPEPSTALLLGVGLAGLGMRRRRQRTHWRGCC